MSQQIGKLHPLFRIVCCSVQSVGIQPSIDETAALLSELLRRHSATLSKVNKQEI